MGVIGPNQVSVPTHLYKVIVVSDPSLAGLQLAAFVVPNEPVENRHLTEFQVDLKKLERESGLTFHPDLDKNTVGDLCKQDGCNLQNYREFQQFLEQATLFSLELAQLGERLDRSNQKRSGHAGFGEGLPR